MMPQMHRFILHPLTGKVFLGVLAGSYLLYLVAVVHVLSPSQPASVAAISIHVMQADAASEVEHWSAATMLNATNADQPLGQITTPAQGSSDPSAGKAAQQPGQPSRNANLKYPLSTVGKLFFTSAAGQDHVCSGTAVQSANQSVVDTAGHCLYYQGGWNQNVIFCPLYESGASPFGCWAARDLEVPSDWINAPPNDLHHDFGMAVVAPNSQGALTDVVGGAGWAYNQPVDQPFYAYGYPAVPPYNGQTRIACENVSGTTWQHGGGSVVSIPCDMTGGSSGGPWFIQINGTWYLNGHNDFTYGLRPGNMYSPYYDDTWYALYTKAQQT